jgi:hypothetical protein
MAAGDKAKAAGAIQRPAAVDDHELDDAFSAWDDDDAGAHRPPPSVRLARAAISSAQTRIERRGAVGPTPPAQPAHATPPALADGSSHRSTPLADALLDPVAMRDIVISRVRTLDDPLTTRVLAEIARRTTRNDVSVPRRPTVRRPIARDEPFRKK